MRRWNRAIIHWQDPRIGSWKCDILTLQFSLVHSLASGFVHVPQPDFWRISWGFPEDRGESGLTTRIFHEDFQNSWSKNPRETPNKSPQIQLPTEPKLLLPPEVECNWSAALAAATPWPTWSVNLGWRARVWHEGWISSVQSVDSNDVHRVQPGFRISAYVTQLDVEHGRQDRQLDLHLTHWLN